MNKLEAKAKEIVKELTEAEDYYQHYSINVSTGGVHYFATAEHSIKSLIKLEAVILLFLHKFPAKDGWKLSVSGTKSYSRSIEV